MNGFRQLTTINWPKIGHEELLIIIMNAPNLSMDNVPQAMALGNHENGLHLRVQFMAIVKFSGMLLISSVECEKCHHLTLGWLGKKLKLLAIF